jgi:hypothetical protein
VNYDDDHDGDDNYYEAGDDCKDGEYGDDNVGKAGEDDDENGEAG